MDIIKFNNPTAPTKMEQGEIVNGLTSKLWIERYVDPGEFSLIAPADNAIRNKLSIGTLISHVDTKEIMIVENHEINAQKDDPPEILISGRSFETFLENRAVASNRNFPVSGVLFPYGVPANYTWVQAVQLIFDHIDASILIDPDNVLPYVSVVHSVIGTGVSKVRIILPASVYERLMELLAINNLGIKTARPGGWPGALYSEDIALVIHRGVNRTSTIAFSYDLGEIESADYLWSNKNFKNGAFISGKWVQTVVYPTGTGYNRRMLYVNGRDIDEGYDTVPTGGDLTDVINAMQQRGIEVLSSLNQVAITKAEASKDTIRYQYRKDYDLGDIITVMGDYNESTIRRVSEYVEIEDSNGERGYPTLTIHSDSDYEVPTG